MTTHAATNAATTLERGAAAHASPAQPAIDLAAIKAQTRDLEQREKIIRDWLMPRLADSDTVEYAGQSLLTYRANKPSQETDWSKLAMAIMSWADFDTEQTAEWLNKHTTTQPGARVMRLAKNLGAA